MAEETHISFRAYYRHVGPRAVHETRKLIGAHVLFAVFVLLVTYVLGVAAGKAVDGRTLTSLVLYPLAVLGIVALLVFGAELAYAPVRLARDEARGAEELRRQIPVPASRPPLPLEEWLQARLDVQAGIRRQRHVRGDRWYFGAMSDWDVDNVKQLATDSDPVAPVLVDSYRRDPRSGHVDGPLVGGGPDDSEEYFNRRIDWLKGTLGDLRADDDGSAFVAASPLVHDLRWHLHKGRSLQAQVEDAKLAGVFPLLPDIERWTQQAHARLRERPALAERFLRAHPGLTSSHPMDQMVDARAVISARVKRLEEIVAELSNEDTPSRGPQNEHTLDRSDEQA